jgi:polyisoprenoid-binding protein YceI
MKSVAVLAVAAGLAAGAPCLGGLCPVAAAVAQEAESKSVTYHFGTSASRTSVLFESDTDLETIHGSTQVLSGTGAFDFEKGTGTTTLTVPVANMKTGQDMRDQHLRSKDWLDAEKFPEITFAAKKLERKEKKEKSEIWACEGSLTIHGVTKDLKGEATVARIPSDVGKKLGEGDWVKVATSFQVTLKEFDIKVPEVAAAKVSPTWDIKVTIYGTTEAPKKK